MFSICTSVFVWKCYLWWCRLRVTMLQCSAKFLIFQDTEVFGWFMSKITKLCLNLKFRRENCRLFFSGHDVCVLSNVNFNVCFAVICPLGCCFPRYSPWHFGETSIREDRRWCGRINELHAEHIGMSDIYCFFITVGDIVHLTFLSLFISYF